jgi:hypothetical protein
MNELCEAGRRCGMGGKWRTPCCEVAIHAICSPAAQPILLCDKHFQEAAAAGFVKDQNIGKEEFDRRESHRRKSP